MTTEADSDIEIIHCDNCENIETNDGENEVEIIPNPSSCTMSRSVLIANNDKKRKMNFEQEDERIIQPPSKKPRISGSNHSISNSQNEIFKLQSLNMSQQIMYNHKERKNKKKKKKVSHDFWKVHFGLNYQGKCLNSECMAYMEPISIKRGFGNIEPLKDFDNGYMKCPGCSKIFDVQTIAIYKATGNVEYKSMDDMDIKTKQISVNGCDVYKFGKSKMINDSNGERINNSSNVARKDKNGYKVLRFDVKRHINS